MKLPNILTQLFIATALLVFQLMLSVNPAQAASSDLFGEIKAPPGVENYNKESATGIGLIPFMSNMIRVATIAAGIFVLFNVIIAGWIYVGSSGDSGASQKVTSRLNMSLIGLLLIVGAYTITAVISLIIFGDASYILNPVFYGPGV